MADESKNKPGQPEVKSGADAPAHDAPQPGAPEKCSPPTAKDASPTKAPDQKVISFFAHKDDAQAKVTDGKVSTIPEASKNEKIPPTATVKKDAEKAAPTATAKKDAEKTAPTATVKKDNTKGAPIKKAKKAEEKNSPPAVGDKVSQSKKDSPASATRSVSAPVQESPAEATPPSRPVEDGKVVYLKLSELHAFHTFREHPFKVEDDAKMIELVGTIKEHGVMTPATVRPEKDGNGYEIVAGHRRCRGSELAGLGELPCIIRNMTDHEAVQEMKNSNKQRGDPLPSEIARMLDLEMEDIKHQGSRLKNVAQGDIGKRSAEIVGENNRMNYKKVMRYIRLNSLVPELLDMVDGVLDKNGKRTKKLGFMPAVELSYIKPENQKLIAVSIEGEQASPSVSQAKRLRGLDSKNLLNGDIIDTILSEEKKEVDQVIITTDELNKYFGKEVTPRQMKDQIMTLLDEWKEKQPPEKNAPTTERS